MFQQYLEKKGFTDKAPKASNKVYHEKNVREFDNDKITPAFDKFLDKLRALSKKGVALPEAARSWRPLKARIIKRKAR